jgi:CheY-like chemotaxis protein
MLSDDQAGGRVRMRLISVTCLDPATPAAAKKAPRPGGAAVTARTVLVADADADSRIIYATILRHEGFSVLVASTGSEAVDLISETPPDAVITELALTGVDGLEVLRHAAARWPASHIPVIILTAMVGDAIRERAEEAGCAAFIMKPRRPRDLVADLRFALEAPSRFGLTELRAAAPRIRGQRSTGRGSTSVNVLP